MQATAKFRVHMNIVATKCPCCGELHHSPVITMSEVIDTSGGKFLAYSEEFRLATLQVEQFILGTNGQRLCMNEKCSEFGAPNHARLKSLAGEQGATLNVEIDA